MRRKDLALALLVVGIWGLNFTVIKLGLGGMPPMLLVSLRFTFTVLPAIFFVKRPRLPWIYVLAYGMTAGAGQYTADIYALKLGMPAGLASVILQSQLFFTLILAAAFLKEGIRKREVAGMFLGVLGLILMGLPGNLGPIPLPALLLMILAAIFWAASNIVVRKGSQLLAQRGEKGDGLSLVVYGSLFALPLFYLGALAIEGPEALGAALLNLTPGYLYSVIHLAAFGTLFGFAAWNKLLSRYPAGKVASISLLVPGTGLLGGWLVMGEVLSLLQVLGIGLILAGLVLAHFGLPGRGTGSWVRKPVLKDKENTEEIIKEEA